MFSWKRKGLALSSRRMEKQIIYESPIGPMLIKSDGDSIVEVGFVDREDALNVESEAGTSILLEAKSWVDAYFEGKEPSFLPSLSIKDRTPYQETVYQALQNIPYGETRSYLDIAEMVEKETGHKTSARAVGNAVHLNPIGIMIPCHRVIGKDGSLVGYAAGLKRKKFLLDLEHNGK